MNNLKKPQIWAQKNYTYEIKYYRRTRPAPIYRLF